MIVGQFDGFGFGIEVHAAIVPPRRVSVGPIALSFKQFALRRKDKCESCPKRPADPAISLNFKHLARRLHVQRLHGARRLP
ncbi:hypothetical protein [Bradyrhizobium sp. USDA 3240]